MTATLVQSTITSIPIYSMQTAWLPHSILESVDQMARRFLWNSGSSGHSVHLLNWDTVTGPKDAGCLGIRKARDNNIDMLGKQKAIRK